jgi:hypothetical protein
MVSLVCEVKIIYDYRKAQSSHVGKTSATQPFRELSSTDESCGCKSTLMILPTDSSAAQVEFDLRRFPFLGNLWCQFMHAEVAGD